MLLTIFTPTYNRAYRLPDLYESLCRQTSGDFEWLIVDDGSTDNTEELINGWISEGKISNLRYIKQTNGGKHRAINRGVKEAKGELFFIVDSDDRLTPDAVEWILTEYAKIRGDHSFAGLSGVAVTADGHRVGDGSDFPTIDANALDFRLKYKIKGDMSEVIRTDILREIPFPEYEGEKFCPEAVVWNRVARKYRFRWINKGIYVCEYLPDGLTAKIVALRRNNPRASMDCYSELYHTPGLPFSQKVKAAINYWRFALPDCASKHGMGGPLSLIAAIPGKLMRLHDKK
ncbi:MAG: glycosyltransferase family 2 protein [Pseudoflavonifractor sp.]|nr:glycosyltransferase family 2 protein [Alloprevotella sp.]MCM1116076.1 glycosyltransferase family 2 protein [Pseudoflavonifractor sp.]